MANKTHEIGSFGLPGYVTSELLEVMLFNDRRKRDRGIPEISTHSGGTVVIANAELLGVPQEKVFKQLVARLRVQEQEVTLHKEDFGDIAPKELCEIVAKLSLINIIHVQDTSHKTIPLVGCTQSGDGGYTFRLAPEVIEIYRSGIGKEGCA